ncbi:TPA: ATP/GTP-binding protein [Serratia marcescens]|uniref:AAA family ATPase n=1 Tax=Serratia TaxID=613 RepID=UPI00074558A0|nr:ATP-binding protein [Serratia marcescens]MBH2852715.1 ATP-binding protein [Serratia marcescens]CVC90619.1 Predicted ATPase [Serratia marcescens]
MIIEFSVTNFRSIAGTQVFSLNASKIKGLDECTFKVDAAGQFQLLRSAAIYGANAAGKSNFMRAVRAMHDIVLNSASDSQSGDSLPVSAFKLNPELVKSPSEFEIVFIIDGVRYQYGFSASHEMIYEEWLFAYPKGRPQRWFARAWNESEQVYDWDMGNSLLGEKQVWQKATRANALFLSTAVQLNSSQLKPIFNWFRRTLRMSNVGGWNHDYSASLCTGERKEEILDFLKAADIGIDDVHVKKEKFDVNKLPKEFPDSLKEVVMESFKDRNRYEISMFHRGSDDQLIGFDFDEESDGTRKLFSFSGPWIDSLSKGYVLFIDELHDNLHPTLVKFLVGLFNNPKTNPKGAQLIFTTHETSILNQDVFRRDQVWFCEKGFDGATKIFPLTDFSPRKGRENLEVSYLDGRYGAIPSISDIKGVKDINHGD